MMKLSKKLFVNILFLFLVPGVTYGESVNDSNSPPQFKIVLRYEGAKINSWDERVGSFLKRELRSLGDVTILDSSYSPSLDYSLLILVDLVDMGRGGKFYYASMVITSPYKQKEAWWRNKELEKLMGGLFSLFGDEIYETSYLFGYSSLRDLCANLIAAFDVNFLEPLRKKSAGGKIQ